MSDVATRSATDALSREWVDVAVRARARYVRRVLGYAALAVVMALGVAQFGAILLWALRTTTWWALAPAGLHALGIALAVGWPTRAGTSLLAPVHGFKAHLAARLGDRADRLRALRTVVALEAVALFVWPLVRFLATGETLRWGVTFTTAICSLAILWPLSRVTAAEQAEVRRLLGVDETEAR